MNALTGDIELIAKLQRLKKTEAKAAIRKGTRQGAKVIMAAVKETAPFKSGALRQAIKVRALPRKKDSVGATVKVKIRYGAFVEFGTKKMKAKHYLEEAAKQTKAQAISVAQEIIATEIETRMS